MVMALIIKGIGSKMKKMERVLFTKKTERNGSKYG